MIDGQSSIFSGIPVPHPNIKDANRSIKAILFMNGLFILVKRLIKLKWYELSEYTKISVFVLSKVDGEQRAQLVIVALSNGS